MAIFKFIILQTVCVGLALTYQCDHTNEYASFVSCIMQWTVVRESSAGHSIFLKDVSLIDEICILPGHPRVDEMDKCITSNVSPFCDSIMVTWKGLKHFVNYLCKYRSEFEGQYARCRKNIGFQSAYENCMAINVQEINSNSDKCRSYTQLQKCLKDALNRFCSWKAARFFSLAFDARDYPIIAYHCRNENDNVDYVFQIEGDSPSDDNKKQESHDSKVITVRPASEVKSEKLQEKNLEVTPSSAENLVVCYMLTIIALAMVFALQLQECFI